MLYIGYLVEDSKKKLGGNNMEEIWVGEITDIESDIWTIDIEGESREEVIKLCKVLAEEEDAKVFRIGKKNRH